MQPPNVHYSLNQRVTEPNKFVYSWDHKGTWTQCSKLCLGKKLLDINAYLVIMFMTKTVLFSEQNGLITLAAKATDIWVGSLLDRPRMLRGRVH